MPNPRLAIVLSPKTKALLAIIVRRTFSGQKHNFLTPSVSSLQLGVNFYGAGETIRAHRHKRQRRLIDRTQEFIFVAQGSATMFLYDERDVLVRRSRLNTGDCVLLASGGHGFKIREKTKIIEIKQGPYLPENDKIYLRESGR